MYFKPMDHVPTPETLVSLSIDAITKNFQSYSSQNYEMLAMLPNFLKNILLDRLNKSCKFWNHKDLAEILNALMNSQTDRLHLHNITITNKIFRAMKRCKRVKSLFMNGTGDQFCSTQELNDFLSELHDMNHIMMRRFSHVDDSTLICIADNCPLLTALDVMGCTKVTDDGMRALLKLKNLSCLTISKTQISDKGLNELVEAEVGRNIKELGIDGCSGITSMGIELLPRGCPNIEIMRLNGPDMQEANFKCLKQVTWTYKFSK